MAADLSGPNERATRDELAKLPPDLATGALAAAALEMARGLDGQNSLTSKAMASKEHREILLRLRELSPPAEEKDEVDELRARRAVRDARRSAAAD